MGDRVRGSRHRESSGEVKRSEYLELGSAGAYYAEVVSAHALGGPEWGLQVNERGVEVLGTGFGVVGP